MSDEIEQRVAGQLRDLVAAGDTRRVTLTRVQSPGLRGQGRAITRLRLTAEDGARLLRDRSEGPTESVGAVAEPDLTALHAKIAEGLHSLIPRSEARFPPDMPLGMVSLEIDGEQADFFYPLDPDRQAALGVVLSPAMQDALARMDQVYRQMNGQD